MWTLSHKRQMHCSHMQCQYLQTVLGGIKKLRIENECNIKKVISSSAVSVIMRGKIAGGRPIRRRANLQQRNVWVIFRPIRHHHISFKSFTPLLLLARSSCFIIYLYTPLLHWYLHYTAVTSLFSSTLPSRSTPCISQSLPNKPEAPCNQPRVRC